MFFFCCCFFSSFLIRFKLCSLNNWEHTIIKDSKTQSHAVYRKAWLLIGDVCYVINYREGSPQCGRFDNRVFVLHWRTIKRQTDAAACCKPGFYLVLKCHLNNYDVEVVFTSPDLITEFKNGTMLFKQLGLIWVLKPIFV